MALLYGANHNRKGLLKRVGALSQVAGVRMMELKQGAEAGVHVADVRTGSGLRFQVSLDRGMDISVAEYKGTPLAWRSPNGDVHPSYFDDRGLGWSRSFPGGLLTGCGLTYVGAPCVDEGEELGLHGRLSNTPATNVRAKTEWHDDRCIFRMTGEVRERSLFKENLLLRRTIETELGESTITLLDTVMNEGFRPSPLTMLYHINLGWPLLDDGAELMLNASLAMARDPEAGKGVSIATKMAAPTPEFKEQVFFHDLRASKAGFAAALLSNKKLGLGLFVRYRQKELPRFIEWKSLHKRAICNE